MTQRTIFRIFLLGLPIGLATGLAIAMPIYYYHQGKTTARTRKASQQNITKAELEDHVRQLSVRFGPRNTTAPDKLLTASKYIFGTVTQWELEHTVREQKFNAGGQECTNIIVEIPGFDKHYKHETIVVGAHYDTAMLSPGADANASGTAALLAMTRTYAHTQHERGLRFIFFANGEAPWAGTPEMGSRVSAEEFKAGKVSVIAMVNLDSIGCFRDEPGSQKSPAPTVGLFPETGNFLAAVSAPGQTALLASAGSWFGRERAPLPFHTATFSQGIQPGDDHLPFVECGYPAIKLTTTRSLRNPTAGLAGDTPDTIDFARYTIAVQEISEFIRRLANPRGGQG